MSLLEEHLGRCVADAIQAGGSDAEVKITEASYRPTGSFLTLTGIASIFEKALS